MTRLLHDTVAAAAELSVSPRTLDRLIADGHIKAIKIGRRKLVPHDELVAYIARLKDAS